ncbi:MAG: hypothetical protein R3284_01280, partial [Rubricoccaceae bacterium]|nr:hypothetical protein [Rubricoccaceae bacterium]
MLTAHLKTQVCRVREFCSAILLVTGWLLVSSLNVQAQAYDYDPSWYDASAPYVKIGVNKDGVYAISGANLASAGVALGQINPATLRLLENGIEIPIWFEGDEAVFDPSDEIHFVGRRNTGEEEGEWAYYATQTSESNAPNDDIQSSSYHSLYSATRYYWLTWGGDDGLRYVDSPIAPEPGAQTITSVRQTFHNELNFTYYQGDSQDSGHPYFTHGEGYHWHTFNQNSIRRDSVIVGTRIGPFTSSPSETVDFEARIVAGSAAHHNVILKIRMADGGPGVYVPMDEDDWTGYEYRTLTASVPQNEIFRFNGQVYLEIVSDNQYYDGVTPNKVFTDWFRISTTRHLTLSSRQIMFPSRGNGNYAYSVNGWDPGSAIVYDPTTARRYAGSVNGSGAFVFGDNGNADGVY